MYYYFNKIYQTYRPQTVIKKTKIWQENQICQTVVTRKVQYIRSNLQILNYM